MWKRRSSIDVRSAIHNEPVVACIQVDDELFIVDAEATGQQQNASEFLTKKCHEIISNVAKWYNSYIKRFVSNIAKNMEKLRNELRKEKMVKILNFILYEWEAHWLNILGEDITPTGVLKHVMKIHEQNKIAADKEGHTAFETSTMCNFYLLILFIYLFF